MTLFKRLLGVVLLAACLLPSAAPAALGAEKLTMEQMKENSEKMLASMRSMRENGEAALRKARSDGDWARLDCVNSALIALKGVLKLSEDDLYELQAEFKLGNAKGVQVAYTKLGIAATKIEGLDARLRACGGPTQEGVVEGVPVVERTKDQDLPNVDPLQNLEADSLLGVRPQVPSPY
jgi:hypothetical protein